ncbi:MAG: HAD hydrolase-like protein, partial [Clostridia bacterium]|nr:HAD hydrolase-like protein [Clostridia bacterium]
ELFREYFAVKGIFENRLFEGMDKLLNDLYAQGYDMLLATSKPVHFAYQVLEYFNIKKYFSYVSACPIDESTTSKVDIMRIALEHTVTKSKSEILMIGDTWFDINGAVKCGIDSIGVLYGTDGETELANATYLAKNVDEIRNILL